MNEKQQVIFNLDLLRRYLENFDPGFFCNAINHKAFVDDLKKAGEMLARYVPDRPEEDQP